jgi:glycosyltransferase involved in cell wall biosynthesis
LLSTRLKNYETAIVNQFDGIIALTTEDKQLYKQMDCRVPVTVSPIGLDTEQYPVNKNSLQPLSVVHLGSMDWLPNIEGVDWFLNEVYPKLRNLTGEIPVFLAGKNMPERIFALEKNGLHIRGRIDDAKKFLFDKQIMIVPLLSGGGMRVKIIEGMAMGKTIISTSIGAEGIRCENGKNILIADSAEDFSNAILKCLENPEFTYAIGYQARLLAESEYENKVVGSGIMKFYHSLAGPEATSVLHYKQ